ncbi:VOC family protein [Hyphomonas sp.]|uniref:VOC family protein n=1 Tax=Hyphomonas sp. TaxID=87 RepID=UPI00391AFDFB
MINGVDHIVILTPEIEAGTAVYAALLGRAPDWRAISEAGVATALFQLGNTALELVAPAGEGPAADHLRARITEEGPGLKSLAFRSTDLSGDHRALGRLALAPAAIEPGASTQAANGATRTWRRFRCPPEHTAGVRWFFVEPLDGAIEPAEVPLGHVHALDHLVINTPNPDRAMALYGAKLGLRLALDRSAPEWGVSLIFFRTGGLTVEIAHRLGQGEDPSGPDSFWGLTWRVGDIEAAHARLAAKGFNVSDVRTGRRAGTQVFTVRDGTMNVPTLFISGVAD